MTEGERLEQLARKMRETENKGLSEQEIKEKEQQKEEKINNNIRILNDTLNILKKGSYIKNGKEIKLKFSQEQMRKTKVFLPEDIEKLHLKSAKTNTSAENRAKSRHIASAAFSTVKI